MYSKMVTQLGQVAWQFHEHTVHTYPTFHLQRCCNTPGPSLRKTIFCNSKTYLARFITHMTHHPDQQHTPQARFRTRTEPTCPCLSNCCNTSGPNLSRTPFCNSNLPARFTTHGTSSYLAVYSSTSVAPLLWPIMATTCRPSCCSRKPLAHRNSSASDLQ